jgi:chemotaxis protein CheD
MDFCAAEGFKVISNHTLGSKSRVVLLTNNFETYIKTLDSSNSKIKDVVHNEVKLQKEISTSKINQDSSIELF